VAQPHDGSLGLAHAFIDAIADAGADAVKFQTHIATAESTAHERAILEQRTVVENSDEPHSATAVVEALPEQSLQYLGSANVKVHDWARKGQNGTSCTDPIRPV